MRRQDVNISVEIDALLFLPSSSVFCKQQSASLTLVNSSPSVLHGNLIQYSHIKVQLMLKIKNFSSIQATLLIRWLQSCISLDFTTSFSLEQELECLSLSRSFAVDVLAAKEMLRSMQTHKIELLIHLQTDSLALSMKSTLLKTSDSRIEAQLESKLNKKDKWRK